MDTKVDQARKFLEHNDKVQVTVLFRGREMQHQQEGRRVLDPVLEKLADVGKVERPPTMDGRRMTAMLAPKVTQILSGRFFPLPRTPLDLLQYTHSTGRSLSVAGRDRVGGSQECPSHGRTSDKEKRPGGWPIARSHGPPARTAPVTRGPTGGRLGSDFCFSSADCGRR